MNQHLHPITEDYIKIPNIFFTEFIQKLSPNEFKLLLVIYKKTHPSCENGPPMLSGCIQRYTGIMTSYTQKKNLAILLDHNLIIKHTKNETTGEPIFFSYSIHPDFYKRKIN